MHYTHSTTVLVGLFDQLNLSDEELADAMRVVTARTSQGGAGPVSVGMIDLLVRTTSRGRSKFTARTVGRTLSDRTYAEQLIVQHEAVQTTYTLARSLDTRQVATLLSRTTTTITRAAGRTLHTYREGRSLRFSTQQFHEGRPTPGLATVVPALREGLTPAIIEARMTTSDLELLNGMTPAQWLIAGGDPVVVVQQFLDTDHR